MFLRVRVHNAFERYSTNDRDRGENECKSRLDKLSCLLSEPGFTLLLSYSLTATDEDSGRDCGQQHPQHSRSSCILNERTATIDQ